MCARLFDLFFGFVFVAREVGKREQFEQWQCTHAVCRYA